MTKTVYSYNLSGEYVGEIIARRDPVEKKERYLIPANATDKVPTFEEGKLTKFVNGDWVLENPPPPPEPKLLTLEEAKTLKINQLNNNRRNYCLIPIEHNNKTYATTLEGKQAISFLTNNLPTSESVSDYITYPQDEVISLTKADFQAIASLIQAREMDSRATRRSKIEEINSPSITTLAQVEGINIEFV